jgi:hypothetical protein
VDLRAGCVVAVEASVKPRGRWQTLGIAAGIFLLGAAITPKLFVTPYTAEMGSIEAAFIGLARYVSRHWNDLGWFPLWYGGIPYADSYPPLLHWVVAAVIALTGASPGLAYHFVTACAYCLGPAALFWMAWRLSRSRACAALAAIGYALFSPTLLFDYRSRLSAGGLFGPRRLITLIAWGEGPHVASLCLVPLAIGVLHVAFKKRKPWWWVAAAVAMSAPPLTNWLGAVALATALLAYWCAGLPESMKPLAAGARMAGVAVLAYAFVVPWLGPSTIAVIRSNAPRVAGDFVSDGRQRLFATAVAVAFALMAWAMRRVGVARHTRFAALVALVMSASALGAYWFKLALFPQPDRYHLEMDQFLWLTAVFAVWPLVAGRTMLHGGGAASSGERAMGADATELRAGQVGPHKLDSAESDGRVLDSTTESESAGGANAPKLQAPRPLVGGRPLPDGRGSDCSGETERALELPVAAGRKLPWIGRGGAGLGVAIAVLVAIAFVPVVKQQRRMARWLARPVRISETIEFKTAKWLEANRPGARVFAPGTIGYWLNAFSDAPQLTGGFDNGIRNPSVPDAIFSVYAGTDPKLALGLMRAYGCDFIMGGDRSSAEFYHPLAHPEILHGLRPVWREGGDTLYEVAGVRRSLAFAMRREDLVTQAPAQAGFRAIDAYLTALDNPAYPEARLQWRGASAASIVAELKPEDVLSVQVAWDQGWHATANGRKTAVRDDKLGQMVLEPGCSGPCRVELWWDGGAEGAWSRGIARTAAAGSILWILVTAIWQKRSASTKTN